MIQSMLTRHEPAGREWLALSSHQVYDVNTVCAAPLSHRCEIIHTVLIREPVSCLAGIDW